jgi:hypothetical protein
MPMGQGVYRIGYYHAEIDAPSNLAFYKGSPFGARDYKEGYCAGLNDLKWAAVRRGNHVAAFKLHVRLQEAKAWDVRTMHVPSNLC